MRPETAVELSQLVALLEAPAFAPLRLQLLQPGQHPALLRAVHGLLMLLPQVCLGGGGVGGGGGGGRWLGWLRTPSAWLLWPAAKAAKADSSHCRGALPRGRAAPTLHAPFVC